MKFSGVFPAPPGTGLDLYLGRAVFGPADSWGVPGFVDWLIRFANLTVYAGTLFHFWKKRKPGEVGLSEELAIAALLSLIISPHIWRHHFALALLPLIWAWMQAREASSRAQLRALSLVTVAIGTPFADFALLHLHQNILQALLSSVFLIASAVLLLICLRDYGCPKAPEWETENHSDRPVSSAILQPAMPGSK